MMLLSRRINAKCFSGALIKPNQLIPKFMSSSVETPKNEVDKPKEVLVYTGKYCNRMKWLRRVSMGSSFASILFVPLSLTIDSGLMPIIGQAAIATTVLVTSMSSTAFLALIGHPYVGTLHEIFQPANVAEVTKPERRFKASKFTLFGNLKYSEFNMSDATKDAKNPFASFQVKKNGGTYYMYGGFIEDDEIRSAFTKDTFKGERTKLVDLAATTVISTESAATKKTTGDSETL